MIKRTVEDVVKSNTHALLLGMKITTFLMEKIWKLIKNPKNKIP
jgi:hypothetical protein